jgi:uncharacterized iron-regulated membrane protein
MKKPQSIWSKTRKFFNDIHLWLGLGSGILVFLICLSGTIYVYNTELKELASPKLYNVEYKEGSSSIPIETLVKKVGKETKGNVISVKIPSDPSRSYTFMVRKKESDVVSKTGKKSERSTNGETNSHNIEDRSKNKKDEVNSDKKEEKSHDRSHIINSNKKSDDIKKPQERGSGGGGRGTSYFVNPYTGEILGDSQSEKNFVSSFLASMFSLHRWLLLDKIEEPIFGELPNRKLGSYISGGATIIFTLGVLTGMIIWVPKRVRSWKQGLKIKWSGNWKRINHDLHNSLGFYSCFLLLLMSLTGPQWSFNWYRDGLRKTLGTYQAEDAPKPKTPKSTLILDNPNNLSIANYMAITDENLTYIGDYTVMLPTDSLSAITINKSKVGFFAPAASDKILLDQYSGEVLELDIFKDKPFNERISASIKALHIGDVYGSFSKLLYFFSCLIATTLPVTGTIIWINKLKKKSKKKLPSNNKVIYS